MGRPIFHNLRRWKYHRQVRLKYRRAISTNKNSLLKILIGSGATSYEGWLSTDYPFFDITNAAHWNYIFKKRKADHLLAEHVLEHLTPTQVEKSLQNAFKHLNPGGIFRIAVPDKNHPNPDYIEHVRPGGSGPGCDDHKSFWDYNTFSQLACKIGFKVSQIEFYDESGNLNSSAIDIEKGPIKRSCTIPNQSIHDYSSLVLDLHSN